MKIGGFIKQSLIDYPGHIAAMIFTSGCNFRCGYCHNPHLVLPEIQKETKDYEIEEIMTYLSGRRNWLDAVVISGGEPCIHKDLPQYIKRIKEMGYAVKLDTNGSYPEMLMELIEQKLIDYVAMDVKHIPCSNKYSEVIGLSQSKIPMSKINTSISLLKAASIPFEFRTTMIPEIHTDADISETEKLINVKIKTQQYRNGLTIASCRA